jgi:hypothetical protein
VVTQARTDGSDTESEEQIMAQQDDVKPAAGDEATAEATCPPPLELDAGGKRKGKKRYSRGLKEPEKMADSYARAASRLARAVADGVDEYRRSRDKSARRKRDGAIRDVVRNVGRGLEEALTQGAKVPTDLSKRVSVRRFVRFFVPPPFNGFLR